MLPKESNLSTALRGAPLEFFPDSTIEERMLSGGMTALILFFPIVVLGYVVDRLTKGSIRKLIHKINNAGTLVFISVYSGMFLLSIFFVCLGTMFLTYFAPAIKTQIVSIRLADDTHRLTKYEGMFLVGRRGKNYIFADKGGSTVYLLGHLLPEWVISA
jgi:hypothetical protein